MNQKFSFSRRTDWETHANALAQTLRQFRQSQTPVIDLTESNPTLCGFNYPQAQILQALMKKENLIYAPDPQGLPDARQAISQDYKQKGYDVAPEQIFLTSSTSEGYSHLFRLLTDVDHAVVFPKPSYPLFQFLVDINDITMDRYPLIYDQRWSIDFESLKEMIGSQTRAVAVVNPNNPTGSFMNAHDIDELNILCASSQLAIISDEVFFDYSLDEKVPRKSFVGNQPVLTFTLGGFSKALGLPQMKLSWIVISGPPDQTREAQERLEIICDTYLSVNTPVQNAAAEWFSLKKDIQGQISRRIKNNLSFIQKTAKARPECELLNVQGGWYAILRMPKFEDEEGFCLELLQNDHVFAHPGYFFDFDNGAHLVLSLLPKEAIFQEGIERLIKCCINFP